jgi:hypothetical protein
MKGKQILASFIVLALLGAYFYFIEVRKKGEDDKTKATGEMLIPGLSGTQAVEMEIDGGNGNIVLKKNTAGWSMEKPIQVPADSSACDNAVAQLAGGKYSRKLENINPGDFGLLKPLLKVSITGADNKKYGIDFGAANLTGSDAYAALSGDTLSAYTVQVSLKTQFEKKVFDWRDKKVLNLQDMDIDRIEVAVKDKKYTLARTGEDWKVATDGNAAARADRVKSLIDQLKNVSAISMIDPSQENLLKNGLVSPPEHIAFRSGKKEAALYFGKKGGKDMKRFARSTYHKDIIEIPEGTYTGISAVDFFLEKRVTAFEQARAVKLKIRYTGREILALKKSVKNTEGTWEVKETKGFKDDEKKKISPASIVYYVSALEYREKIASKPGASEETLYGIKAGQGIEIYGDNDLNLVSFLIGKQVEGKEEFYIKIPSTGAIYTVDKSAIRGLGLPGFEVK